MANDPRRSPVRVHLLDVGPEEYGDAVLCQFGTTSVLIDGAHPADRDGQGAHPSIPDQIGHLLAQRKAPYHVSLLIVTHGHLDHIGCLPWLIKDDLVRAEWALVIDPDLAWGRVGADAAWDRGLDVRTRTLLAGLREEIRSPASDDRSLARFLQDAVTLEDRYTTMLTTLDTRGTKLVRYGADDPAKIIDTFSSVGLKILGPSTEHLRACAALIAGGADDFARLARDRFGANDSVTPVDAYRQLLASDAVDASRLGAAVNLQSIVTTFERGGRSVFLGGDMQFAAPGVQDPAITSGVHDLRAAIAGAAPFTMAKLSHHGSDNAFDEEMFSELKGTKLFGICAGEGSTRHPNKATLDILQAHAAAVTWARTDHNGQSTFDLSSAKPKVTVSSGRLNDPVPNSTDTVAPPPASPATVVTRTVERAGDGAIEVTTRIPFDAVRVTVTVEVEPRTTAVRQVTARRVDSATTRTLTVGAGRTLPRLLFVTSAPALARNIGQEEARAVMDALLSASGQLLSDLPDGVDSTAATGAVQAWLARDLDIKGVVIVGGHDVVPARHIDCLPPALRAQVRGGDADHFFVWSDDPYGDRDGDGIAELAVSRIPDGKSADLVFAALAATGTRRPARAAGIRNIARPFAAGIFRALPGAPDALISTPTVFNQVPAYSLDADWVYLMLHGDYADSKRFWGEQTPDDVEAVNVSNIPASAGAVVFTGCCWGALTVDPPAGRYLPGQAVEPKTAEGSIALAFLRSGALAFIGCTGSHYSPTVAPYQYYGGPLHAAFWASLSRGLPPAEALFAAKVQYVQGLPYGQRAPDSQAIGYKIFRQYTCLGLGW